MLEDVQYFYTFLDSGYRLKSRGHQILNHDFKVLHPSTESVVIIMPGGCLLSKTWFQQEGGLAYDIITDSKLDNHNVIKQEIL